MLSDHYWVLLRTNSYDLCWYKNVMEDLYENPGIPMWAETKYNIDTKYKEQHNI